MNVFVVLSQSYEEDTIHGVYASLEDAQASVDVVWKLLDDPNYPQVTYYGSPYNGYRIERHGIQR
jgi:hypothetical protein